MINCNGKGRELVEKFIITYSSIRCGVLPFSTLRGSDFAKFISYIVNNAVTDLAKNLNIVDLPQNLGHFNFALFIKIINNILLNISYS